jgi:RimJ/RimL family protein N-acetyltransferase
MGLRPVNLSSDLGQVADLIELCFGSTMDAAGRAAVEEMRWVAGFRPALWVMRWVDQMTRGVMQGFVWEEDGHIVGNVSLYPSGYNSYVWIIANVAVHPDYRGRGYAIALCRAALERIQAWRGSTAILQVDADNPAAIHVYEKLRFRRERVFTRWVWTLGSPPKKFDPMPYITYKSWAEGPAAYALAKSLRPNERGGLGWLRPTQEGLFKAGWGQWLLPLNSYEQWVIRGEDDGPPLRALMLVKQTFGSGSLHFDMLIHPSEQGRLEVPLLNYTLRRAAESYKNASTDHPADDLTAEAAFRQYGFQPRRSLLHMAWYKSLSIVNFPTGP